MSDFESKRITRIYHQHIYAQASDVFPLLCPIKQKEWLDGWNCQMIFSESGFLENRAVFKTKHNEKSDTIWVVTKYDPENYTVEYIRMTWDTVVVNIRIILEDNHDGSTKMIIEYVFTSLGDKGNEFIEGNSAKMFIEMMKWWEKSLNYYLETGAKLMALKL